MAKQFVHCVLAVLRKIGPGRKFPVKAGLILLIALPIYPIAARILLSKTEFQVNGSNPTASEQVDDKKDPLVTDIERLYPKISDPTISDWEKVNFIRRWAYRNINVSSTSCLLEKKLYPDFYKKTALDFHTIFNQEFGGVWCGGSAFFLVKLYQHYGYKAYVLSVGKDKLLTHAVTLVEIGHQGQKLHVVQDAYVNTTYTKADGTPLDFFKMIELLQQQNDSQIKTLQDDDGARDFIFCSGARVPDHFYGTPASQVPCEKQEDGNIRCQYRLVLKDLTDRHPLSAPTKKFLANAGYKPDMNYLFMFPYSLNDGNTENQQLLGKAKAIAGRLSPTSNDL